GGSRPSPWRAAAPRGCASGAPTARALRSRGRRRIPRRPSSAPRCTCPPVSAASGPGPWRGGRSAARWRGRRGRAVLRLRVFVPRRLLLVRGLVELLAAGFRHFTHHRPVLLVVD